MPNIGKILKDEIQRVSDKSARGTAAKLRKEIAALKSALVALRKEVAHLKKPRASAAAPAAPAASAKPASASRERRGGMTSKGVLSLRKRLGLTQTAFAKLADVTPQSITLWENKDGPLRLRSATAETLEDLKRIGKREALRRLGGPDKPTAQPRAKTARKARKKKTA